MSVERILQKYTSSIPSVATASSSSDEPDAADDLGSFALLRGTRERSVSIELRKKDDSVLAVPYSLIEQFVYSPSDGITLRAAGREIRIRGRYLNTQTEGGSLSLFSAIARQRVPWLAEQRRSAPQSSEAPTIESITW